MPFLTGIGLMQLALAAHLRLSVVFISAYGDQICRSEDLMQGGHLSGTSRSRLSPCVGSCGARCTKARRP
jgi:hypothetical protein